MADRRKLVACFLFLGVSSLFFQNCARATFKGPSSDAQKVDSASTGNPGEVSPNEPPPETPSDVDNVIDRVHGDCQPLTNDPIAYDSLPVGAQDYQPVSVLGGNFSINREYISSLAIFGGHHNVQARDIQSIGQLGGYNYYNSSSIGSIASAGGRVIAVTNSIERMVSFAGSICVSTDKISEDLSSVAGHFIAQGRSDASAIPQIDGIFGGNHSFKDFKIDKITGILGGVLVLENCQVNSIEGMAGGRIILKNSQVGLIKGVLGGSIILDNTSVLSSVENAVAFKVIQ